MRLSTLVEGLEHRRVGPPGDPEVRGVTHDSRRAGAGILFAAFPGRKLDGREFVAEAVLSGAPAAIGPAPAPDGVEVPYLEVENPRRAAGLLAARLAGDPSGRLVTAGVTGTSGKTTTTLLIDEVLAGAHPKRGLFGTLVYRWGEGTAGTLDASRTTPEATELQPMLAALVAGGGTAVTLECSSHALWLERLAGCTFDVAVFLNLTRDHLDDHGTMDAYFEEKAKLFSLLKPGGTAVVNADDPWGRRLLERLPKERTLSFSPRAAPRAPTSRARRPTRRERDRSPRPAPLDGRDRGDRFASPRRSERGEPPRGRVGRPRARPSARRRSARGSVRSRRCPGASSRCRTPSGSSSSSTTPTSRARSRAS